MLSVGFDTGPHWPLVYCPVDDTLFEVSPEICCSGVSSRYSCYGNHTAAVILSQFKEKFFFTVVNNWLQQVEEDVGLSVGAAWIAGQDRSMWRTLRPSAGQAQQ